MPDYISVLNLDGTNRNVKDAGISSWARASTKPSYTASEVGAIASTTKGTANGVAELDSTGKVPSSQLPSYVDDVLEYNSTSAFPSTGEAGKIYIAKDTNKAYRWSGSAYVEISPSLALGETSSTAYRGDRGKTAYDHSQTTSGNPHNVTKSDVGLGNVGNFKAVSTIASQGLTDTEKANARANIGAGTSSLALGTSSSTAYRGDYGNSAYAHAVTNKGSAFSSGLYKITTNSEGHVTAATAVAKSDITGLGIPGRDTNNAVTQTATTTNANYEVLFSSTADNTTRTEGARKNSNLLFNPNTGNLQATQLNGVTIGSSPKFTDTNTWRGIQNNLTSDSTTDSLSAKQGKVLKGLIDAPISDTEWTALTALFA